MYAKYTSLGVWQFVESKFPTVNKYMAMYIGFTLMLLVRSKSICRFLRKLHLYLAIWLAQDHMNLQLVSGCVQQ